MNQSVNKTYFVRGWIWDNTVTFIQYYNERPCAKFIVKMKYGFKFEDFIK